MLHGLGIGSCWRRLFAFHSRPLFAFHSRPPARARDCVGLNDVAYLVLPPRHLTRDGAIRHRRVELPVLPAELVLSIVRCCGIFRAAHRDELTVTSAPRALATVMCSQPGLARPLPFQPTTVASALAASIATDTVASALAASSPCSGRRYLSASGFTGTLPTELGLLTMLTHLCVRADARPVRISRTVL